MLPDFPVLKKRIQRMIEENVQEQIRQDPFLSRIRKRQVFEGLGMSLRNEKGEIIKTNYEPVSAPFAIEKDEIIIRGHIAFIEDIQSEMVEEIKEKQTKFLIQETQEAAKNIKNVVNGKDRPFTFHLFLEALDKMWIDFDDQGNPYMPDFVVSPDVGAKLKIRLPEWKDDPEYKEELERIIVKKRREWCDREGHRKLVD